MDAHEEGEEEENATVDRDPSIQKLSVSNNWECACDQQTPVALLRVVMTGKRGACRRQPGLAAAAEQGESMPKLPAPSSAGPEGPGSWDRLRGSERIWL